MKILFLTNNDNTRGLSDWLREMGEEVFVWQERLTAAEAERLQPELAISFNYRYIIPADAIAAVHGRILNLHTSYLPWNKGSSPNFFSFLYDTPKGVTIHLVDETLDTGAVLFQEELFFDETKETFETTYQRLLLSIIRLFQAHWEEIREWRFTPYKPAGRGSYHTTKELRTLQEKADFSWQDNIALTKKKLQAFREKEAESCAIGIRADGNPEIGMGHVMRCLSIAQALRKQGERVLFFTADEAALPQIQAQGFEAVCLHSQWKHPETEQEALLKELRERQIRLLLADSYFVTEEYLRAVGKEVCVAYLDDLCAFDYPVALLINYSVYAKDMAYTDRQKEKLLGMEYAPLREQFQEQDKSEGTRKKQILVLSGATDPYQVGEKLPLAILRSPVLAEYDVAVVRGPFADADEATCPDRVRYLRNVSDMAALMRESALAVSAGGSTLYELCACGVPAVTYSFTDNQLGNVEGFAKRGLLPYAGDLRKEPEKALETMVHMLEEFARAKEETQEKRETLMRLADGRGAARIAEILCKKIRQPE